MGRLAIIGGSGLYSPGLGFELETQAPTATPFGETSADILLGKWDGMPLVFLSRHGPDHRVPPHKINYRANIWALKELGVEQIISVNAVGGITAAMLPLTLVVPDQLIDYSSGREATFFDGDDGRVRHIDFTQPYSASVRGIISEAAFSLGIPLVASAVYACTNGPRLETAAEVQRLGRDGCDVVGMTGMPEAVLARELDIDYAALALVVNKAAGIDEQPISMEAILGFMEQGMESIRPVLRQSLKLSQL
ncbi:MAG: 5'-methylthioinosine phosphorylase [Planctomycetota bacterium]|jgi:5'-methylthioinosine phosphorylase